MFSKSKHVFAIFCFFIIFIQIIQIVYFERATFTARYNVEYWKDRYEHSQYQLPLSKRIIGDDGLFAYSGYRLIKGDNPFSINVDKPPVAKYLFGLSILLFQNPLLIVLFFGLCTLIVFYFLAKYFLKSRSSALFVTTLFFLDPLFFSQFWVTTLDLMQLFFLLLNMLFFVNIDKLRRYSALVALGAGLSLGLFVEVKPPIVVPIIFVLETIFLLYKGFLKEYFIFISGLLLGIVIPYLRFIFLGNGIVEIIKIHKYMASIYLQSELKAHVGAIWLTLFVGKFPNIVTGSLINVFEWWILWPVLTLSGITMTILSFFTKKIPAFNKGLAVFLLATLFIFTFIPSYPRYLALVLPFLYLFGISFWQRFINRGRYILYLILLIFGVINSFFFLLPKPETSLNGFYYNLSHLYFYDIYQENIAKVGHPKTSRETFRFLAQGALENATVKAIEVKEIKQNIPIFGNSGNAKISVTYKTENLGSFSEDKEIELIRQEGQWKIIWNWDLILTGFLPEYNVVTTEFQGKRGKIIDAKSNVLAEDVNGHLITINPEEIDLQKEDDMLTFLSSIGYVKGVHLQNAYLENPLPGSYVPLFTLHTYLTDDLKKKILSFSGIKIVPHGSRIYTRAEISPLSIKNVLYEECCTRIYSSNNYHGVEGAEKEYDKVLSGHDGGKVIIRDKKGNIIRNVLDKSKKDGQDIILYD